MEPGPSPPVARTASIDTVRGIVMVLMVLDHARDFFFGTSIDPTDLATTTVVLFFTRWVTHFCAPVFVFLAGTAAHLYGVRHGRDGVTRFLLTRGAWLVLLELTVVRFAWIPDPTYSISVLQVIWTLGWAMIVLAVLSRLPRAVVLVFGAAIVAGHNLLDPVDHLRLGWLGPLWSILHHSSMLEPVTGHRVWVLYPVLAWLGVIALGWCAGALFELPRTRRRRWLTWIGVGACIGFVVIRAVNVYGDPQPWSPSPRGPVFTFVSFLNCEKYPPSLLYLLMTLGPSLLALAAFDRNVEPAWTKPLVVFGRVPLFFYVTHLYLLRLTATPMALVRFGASAIEPPPGHAGSPEFPLWAAYVGWLCVVAALFLPARWFAGVKARSRKWWISYL